MPNAFLKPSVHFQTETRTTYGTYTLASTAANYGYSSSYTDTFTKTYSFVNEVSASGGYSISAIEAKVGFKSDTTKTVSKTFSIVC